MSGARGARQGRSAAPERVGAVLATLLESRGLAETVERAEAIARWEELVGPQIARVAKPAGLREGTLFVEVASASWSMELNLMRRRLLGRLNEGKTKGRIERLVFVQAGGDRRAGDGTRGTNRGAKGHGEGDG